MCHRSRTLGSTSVVPFQALAVRALGVRARGPFGLEAFAALAALAVTAAAGVGVSASSGDGSHGLRDELARAAQAVHAHLAGNLACVALVLVADWLAAARASIRSDAPAHASAP